jgi:nucleotide-binding universal stress UspA family protein
MTRARKSYEPGHQRKFLVVVDETPECDRAVYYGSRRAARTNSKLVLLAVVPVDASNQQWLGVGDLMKQEAQEEIYKQLDHFAARARNLAGIDPERVVREGAAPDEALKLIDEDEDIAVLVLAAGAGTSNEGPGPLVTSLAGAGSATFPIPITIVPGSLSDEELDALS